MTSPEVLERRRQNMVLFRQRNPSYFRDANRRRREKDPDGYAEKQRSIMIKVLYGITVEDYARMFKAQRGRCAICRTTEVGQTAKKNLCIDHCHKTNKVRGLLCFRCNRALGLFYDNPKVIAKAATYLLRSL